MIFCFLSLLNEFGIKSTCFGFVGGFTGAAIESFLNDKGIDCDFVKVAGNTRINVKLNDTDINATGPQISSDNLAEIFKKLDALKDGDFLVLSGSVPKSLPQDVYEDIIRRLGDKISFVVDAEKDLLLGTLKYKPFLIKPNHHELGDIFGVEINDFDSALLYAKKLQDIGAKNVMVTCGDKGAVLLDLNGNAHTQTAPKGDVVSAVGSGDSAVAAFLAEYLSGNDYKTCLKTAVAAGSATAFTSGLATKEQIEAIKKSEE